MSETKINWDAVKLADGGEYSANIELAIDAIVRYLEEINKVAKDFNDGYSALPYPYNELTNDQQTAIQSVLVKMHFAIEHAQDSIDQLRNGSNPLVNNLEHTATPPTDWPKDVLDHFERETHSFRNDVVKWLNDAGLTLKGFESE